MPSPLLRAKSRAPDPMPACPRRAIGAPLAAWRRLTLALGLIAGGAPMAAAQDAGAREPSALTRLLQEELARYPARAGVYVKNLRTGEEAMVAPDQPFNSASVIKLAVMVRAFQLADSGRLDLDERVEIRRADLRDGSGVLQYHALGLRPTVADLITQMIITSDNTATDLMVARVGGVGALNAWLAASGFRDTEVIGPGYLYRRRLLAQFHPPFASLTPEEVTGLQYAAADSPLFALYESLFTGPRVAWVTMMRDPATRRVLGEARNRLTVTDRAFWLGAMTPRETGRLLEGIERGTLASPAATAAMQTALRRQQAGARRIPHYLTVPVGHKTGDSPVIANDVGMVYAPQGTLIMAFFTNGVTGLYPETEDRIGRTAQKVVEYFARTAAPPR